MNTPSDPQLSSELQELYLQNKQWLSDVLFLEDETRFFHKILDTVLTTAVKEGRLHEVQLINASLTQMEERRNKLKTVVIRHHHMLELMLKEQDKKIGLDMINENITIIKVIKALFISDKVIKKELYTLVEGVIREYKAGHLLNA